MAVDIARYPFKSVIRPFADDPTEVTVVWYPCRDDAKTLPFPSDIDVASWVDGSGVFFADGPGTIQDAPRDYQPIKAKIAARGVSFCGTRNDFVNGGVYDPELPPVIYTTSGLPKCCVPIMDVRANGGGNPKSVTHQFPVNAVEGAGGGTAHAKVTKFPPGSGAGTDCLTAGVAPVAGQQCSTLAFGDVLWFAWSGVGGGTFTITLTGLTDADVTLNGHTGTCPGGLVVVPLAHVGGSQTWNGLLFASGEVWITVTGILGAGSFCLTLTQP